MGFFLAASFLLLLQGGAVSSNPKPPILLQDNKTPLLQRIILSDVSNMQMHSGRNSYFGAVPAMVGASGQKSENQGGSKSAMGTGKPEMVAASGEKSENQGGSKSTMDTGKTRSTIADLLQATEERVVKTAQNSVEPFLPTVVSRWKQFPNSSEDRARQFAPLNEASDNSSQTLVGNGVTDSNMTSPESRGEKLNVTDGLSLGETTTIQSNHVSNDSIMLSTESIRATTHETESPPPDTADEIISQTITGSSTSSPTQSPNCKECADNTGLIAGLVVTAMVLLVLILTLLSLYCKRMLLIFTSMCRCTKYTSV